MIRMTQRVAWAGWVLAIGLIAENAVAQYVQDPYGATVAPAPRSHRIQPFNKVMRGLGFGWSDGYHSASRRGASHSLVGAPGPEQMHFSEGREVIVSGDGQQVPQVQIEPSRSGHSAVQEVMPVPTPSPSRSPRESHEEVLPPPSQTPSIPPAPAPGTLTPTPAPMPVPHSPPSATMPPPAPPWVPLLRPRDPSPSELPTPPAPGGDGQEDPPNSTWLGPSGPRYPLNQTFLPAYLK